MAYERLPNVECGMYCVHGVMMQVDCPKCEIESLRAEVEGLVVDRDKLRDLFEHIALGIWEYGGDIEFAEWQNKAESLGLLVSVPASDDIAEEYDTDEMFVWAWSAAALAAKGGE